MSKLIDMLIRKNQSPAPFGFRSARSGESANRLILIAAVDSGNGDVSPEVVKGAHAGLIRSAEGRLTAKAVQTAAKVLDAACWGIADNPDKPISLPSGCDFVLLSTSARPSAAPEDDNVGRLLEVESSMDDGLLRAVNELPVDGVVVTDSLTDTVELNWHELMIFRHVTRVFSVPVIVPVPAGITAGDLKALWDAGVDGILADAAEANIGELRAAIDQLPARSEGRKKRPSAIVPRLGLAPEPTRPAPEPDEEEEEDE